MPYKMNDAQFNAVLTLDSLKRYDHFIGKVADWEQLWGVRSEEGWLVPEAPEGFEYFPVWPHPVYAQKVSDLNFPNNEATEIQLNDFLETWIPKFVEDKLKVAVFPDSNWTFWCMDPNDLKDDLFNEISKYE